MHERPQSEMRVTTDISMERSGGSSDSPALSSDWSALIASQHLKAGKGRT